MSADLRERLDRLASGAPMSVPPRDLWAKGVRRRRADRATVTVLVAAVVTLLALAGSTLVGQVHPPVPASTTDRVGIPRQIFGLSSWGPGTASAGAPGVLAVVYGVNDRQRGWLGHRAGLVGVTAAGGAYRYLDLPHVSLHALVPRLSPDGSAVAYAYTGRVPNGGTGVRGIALYDTASGSVRYYPRTTQRGLVPDDRGGAWTSDSRWFVSGAGQQLALEGASNDYEIYAYALAGRPRQVLMAGIAKPPDSDLGSTPDGRVTWLKGRRLFAQRPGDGSQPAVVARFDRDPLDVPVFSPDWSRLVFGARIADDEGTSSHSGSSMFIARFAVGVTSRHGTQKTALVVNGRLQYQRVLGWLDGRQALINYFDATADVNGLKVLDTVTGKTSGRYLSPESDAVQVATDLLRKPFVPAHRPPWHPDPRPLLGGALALLGAGLWWRRRRVRS